MLAFAPVLAFWLALGVNLTFFVSIAVSLCVLFLPDRIYNQLQLSENALYYEKMGIRFFRKFTQDGDLITKVLAKGQGYSSKRTTKKDFLKYERNIEAYERYHLTCLAFFLLTTTYAILLANFAIALMITFSNVLYNFFPLLLQQYNKLRIKKLKG